MFAVAIDGPSGAGKSSIAKAIAKELGFAYIDTGALYRTIALYILEHGVAPNDAEAIEKLLPEIEIGIEPTVEGQKMTLCGRDVTGLIRTQEISMAASTSSGIPAVRAFLLELQRDLARRGNVLMDGRDIGTVILPDAQLKIFLTASPEERACRRLKQLEESGEKHSFESVLEEVKRRDDQDTNRETAPLKRAEDAILVDSSELTFEETVDKIAALIRERL